MNADHPIYAALLPYVQKDRITDLMRYFQTGPGQYAEGDTFMGIMVPQRREVAKALGKTWSESVLASGLIHPIHEVRHTALVAVMQRFTASKATRGYWHDFLRDHYEGINNWDLVDTCAHKVFGRYAVETGSEEALLQFLESENLWHKRTAVVATLWHIKVGDVQTPLAYAAVAAEGAPEILEKAVGWILKEARAKNMEAVEAHVKAYYQVGLYSKRVVRIALEKASASYRNDFLQNYAP